MFKYIMSFFKNKNKYTWSTMTSRKDITQIELLKEILQNKNKIK